MYECKNEGENSLLTNTIYKNTGELLTLTEVPNEQSNMEVIVKYNGDIHKLEQEIGVEVEDLGYNYAIITLRPKQVQSLYGYTEIEYIEVPKAVFFNLQQELSKVCLPTLLSSSYDLTGRGTIVAVIDSGIDYTHPDFRNEDGSSRILYIWDQTGSGAPPSGFISGVEYTKGQLDEILRNVGAGSVSAIPELDYIGHGTAVAGIACRQKRDCTRCKYHSSKIRQKG